MPNNFKRFSQSLNDTLAINQTISGKNEPAKNFAGILTTGIYLIFKHLFHYSVAKCQMVTIYGIHSIYVKIMKSDHVFYGRNIYKIIFCIKAALISPSKTVLSSVSPFQNIKEHKSIKYHGKITDCN